MSGKVIIAVFFIVFLIVLVVLLTKKKSSETIPNIPDSWTQEQAVSFRDKLYDYMKTNKPNLCGNDSDLKALCTCMTPFLCKVISPGQIDECIKNPESCANVDGSNTDVDFNDFLGLLGCISTNAKTCDVGNFSPQTAATNRFKLISN
jgi:hypothetical protein